MIWMLPYHLEGSNVKNMDPEAKKIISTWLKW